jgi:hypothetical protein
MTQAVQLAQYGANNVGLSFKNRIINGDMGIWQRGTSFSAIGTGTYTADRWQSTTAGSSLSLTATQSTSVPSTDFAYSLQFQQLSSSATSVTEYAARQRFELANVRDLAGKIITISFWYRSNITGTHGVRILPLGTTGGVDTSVAITVNSANTWEYKTVTTTALSALTSWGATADNGAALILDIGLRVNGVGQTTIAANTYFQLTGAQLEIGSVATSFDYLPYTTELQLCQRYTYRRLADGSINNFAPMGTARYFGTNAVQLYVPFPVTMRTSPGSITVSGTFFVNDTTFGGAFLTSIVLNETSSDAATVTGTTTTGTTAGFATTVYTNESSVSFIIFNAEL